MNSRLVSGMALALAITACTTAGDSDSTVATAPTATSFATGETVTTTVGPEATSTTEPERLDLRPPFKADLDDVAARTFRELDGYEVGELTEAEEELAATRLGRLIGDFLAGASITALIGGDGTSIIAVAGVLASGSRGDPSIVEFVPAFVAFDETIPVDDFAVPGGTGVSFGLDDRLWYVAMDNTHLYITTAASDAAADAAIALMSTDQDAYQWEADDCLYFPSTDLDDALPFSPFGDFEVVSCTGTHTHEVIMSSAFAEGPDEPYPSDMSDRRSLSCDPAFERFVGVPFYDTTINSISYAPDQGEWAEGDRYVACLIELVDDGVSVPKSETLSGRGIDFPYSPDIGDCRAPFDRDAIPCTAPHRSEFIGVATLDGNNWPGPVGFGDLAADACQELLDGYGVVPGAASIDPVWDPIGIYAWNEGVRDVRCYGAAFDSGGFPVLIVGSLRDQWRPVGGVGDGIEA